MGIAIETTDSCNTCTNYSHQDAECHRTSIPEKRRKTDICDHFQNYTEEELTVIEQLQKTVASLDEKIDRIEEITSGTSRKMDIHLTEHKSADRQLLELERTVWGFDGKNGLKSRLQRLEDRLDSMKTQIDSQEQARIDRADAQKQINLGWQGWLMLAFVAATMIANFILAFRK